MRLITVALLAAALLLCAGTASSNAQAVDSAAVADPSATPSASLRSSSHIAPDDPLPLFNENDDATPSWLESGLTGQKNAAEAAAKRQNQATPDAQASSSTAPLSLAEAQAATANATTTAPATNVTEPQQLGQSINRHARDLRTSALVPFAQSCH
jgi:hypothetical protein